MPILIVAPSSCDRTRSRRDGFSGDRLCARTVSWRLAAALFCDMCLLRDSCGRFAVILRPYQAQRISGFMDAWKDLSQAPWQIRQSLMSIGSGGLEGTGIGSGWQKLSYLPEANTDFVFAVIGEELGLIGTLAVCAVWMAVFLHRVVPC
jgi:cell division protein FtsW (lipid II flippase)